MVAEHRGEDLTDFFSDTGIRAKLSAQAEGHAERPRLDVTDPREIGGFQAWIAPKQFGQTALQFTLRRAILLPYKEYLLDAMRLGIVF